MKKISQINEGMWGSALKRSNTCELRKEDISNCKSFEELPINCQKYIETIEKLLECSIDIISVSPEKDATIIRKELF